MAKKFLNFLASSTSFNEQQTGKEVLKVATCLAGLQLSDYRIVPLQLSFDHTLPPQDQEAESDRPQGYRLFKQTLEALEEQYPFRAAIIQFQTLLRILMVSCEEKSLNTLRDEDYTLMLGLLHDMDELSTRCDGCPLPPEDKGSCCSQQYPPQAEE